MCGIAGTAGLAERSVLERMIGTLLHRGPDEAGVWIGEGVALGMRRLSIIDVETGHQPVFNEDRSVAVIFNGEIYNFIELRDELVAKGHTFRTHHSDTEVIVHLYEEMGLDFASALNGMFAIALWDLRRKRMILVRDHAGIKPLYYAEPGGALVFGSEPKAVLAHPQVGREPDRQALHHYLSLKNIPAPFSAFRDIRQLRPGERLVWQNGQSTIERWWTLRFDPQPDVTEDEAAGTIRTLLEDSVRLQMRSDVPFGAYLSGGVDSSAVVAIMSRLTEQPVKTFTLVYEDEFERKEADRQFARQVSRLYGTDHHEQVVRFGDVPETLDAIIGSFDEPFSGVISTYFLTQLISRHVKVALSGDGADELFGSYLSHRTAAPLDLIRQNGPNIADWAAEQREALRSHGEDPAPLLAWAARGDEAASRMGMYIADDAAVRDLYSPAMRDAIGTTSTEAMIRATLATSGTTDPLNRALSLDFNTLLPDQVLAFVDRLSMAHSVEVRPPFLDHRLIEYAAHLPGSFKIRNGRVKHILKQAVADLLPADLLDRPKEGFLMPINAWILTRLRSYVEETLSPARLARHGLFDPAAVQFLITAHYAGNGRVSDRLWNLMMLQLWWEKYVG